MDEIENTVTSYSGPGKSVKYNCNLNIDDNCIKIINPDESLACTGRSQNDGFSCCYFNSKHGKKCVPFKYNNIGDIRLYVASYQSQHQLTDVPSMICKGNYLTKNLLLYLLILIFI